MKSSPLFYKISSHFGFYVENQEKELEPLQKTRLFMEDWIGLNYLSNLNKLHLLSMKGDHMDFDALWFSDNIVKKFLVD